MMMMNVNYDYYYVDEDKIEVILSNFLSSCIKHKQTKKEIKKKKDEIKITQVSSI